ncbi:unnamed protein product [Soboliphyme baturini]|uniref:Uncharacterized protein n=1 Tax=Soboliphyme baturini TaxID=241478 RepID=A0A183IMJ6_9BILA|nr:unnamed protein product [Soboliphyme baturini]
MGEWHRRFCLQAALSNAFNALLQAPSARVRTLQHQKTAGQEYSASTIDPTTSSVSEKTSSSEVCLRTNVHNIISRSSPVTAAEQPQVGALELTSAVKLHHCR